MDAHIPDKRDPRSTGFQCVLDAFLARPGLPFSGLLSAERIEQVFAKHNAMFGTHGIYSTAVMVWSFLGQVLRDGKEAAAESPESCLMNPPPSSARCDQCHPRQAIRYPQRFAE
ncbi:MAG: hypothetical protein ABGZ23_00020 [Fuerstiella sp.]